MSVVEIESAIKQLPANELAEFASWFEEFHARAWDRQIEQDIRTGKLDALGQRAKTDFEAGRCKPL